MSRRENRTMPKVLSGVLYHEADGFVIGGAQWQEWLATHLSFYYESNLGTFTARRELRSGSWYWYAFRRVDKKLYKAYLGGFTDLTLDRLNQVAEQLAVKAGVAY